MSVLTRAICTALRRQELAAARDALVAQAGNEILAATEVDVVHGIARRTALELMDLTPETALLTLVRTGKGLRVGDAVGKISDITGTLLPDTVLTEAGEAEKTAEMLCAHLVQPMRLTAATVRVGASIGVALSGPGVTASELTRRADIAMYSAKARGKNRVEVFSPDEHGEVARHRTLEDQSRTRSSAARYTSSTSPTSISGPADGPASRRWRSGRTRRWTR